MRIAAPRLPPPLRSSDNAATLSMSRWPDWLAAQATRHCRVCATAPLGWQPPQDQFGAGHGHAPDELPGLGHAASTMRREQQVVACHVADRAANRHRLFWKHGEGSL